MSNLKKYFAVTINLLAWEWVLITFSIYEAKIDKFQEKNNIEESLICSRT